MAKIKPDNRGEVVIYRTRGYTLNRQRVEHNAQEPGKTPELARRA